MNIIVTGASRGIGYQVARIFASDKNNSVLLISRNDKENEIEKLNKLLGRSSHLHDDARNQRGE